jgi:hypothetical protein
MFWVIACQEYNAFPLAIKTPGQEKRRCQPKGYVKKNKDVTKYYIF